MAIPQKTDKLTKRLATGESLIFDGATGTELYRRNFFINSSFESLCLTNPEVITSVHQAYVDAGAEVLTTNTFGANSLKLAMFGLAEKTGIINVSAVNLVRKAAAGKPEVLIAGSIGPIGDENKASDAEVVDALVFQGSALYHAEADFLLFESIKTIKDVKRAIMAAQEIKGFYVLSFTLNESGELQDGAPFNLVRELIAAAAFKPSALGLNCGEGPESTLKSFSRVKLPDDLPWIIQPNAGTPKTVDGRQIYLSNPEYFTTYAMRFLEMGAKGLGGCCGIGPEHIADMARSAKPLSKGAASHIVVSDSAAKLPPATVPNRSDLAAKISAGKWVKLVELTPPKAIDFDGILAKAAQCREAGFDAINIPDGPRASSRLSAFATATAIKRDCGMETVLHCCSRDRNLIALQSDLLSWCAMGLNNVLFVTGDPPKLGDYPFSSGVFDVDSIGMLKIQHNLNCGIDIAGKELGNRIQTKFFAGAGVDPNALNLEWEISRLKEKIDSGANFVITQPVFDSKSFFKFFDKFGKISIPVIAGVWPLVSYRNAEFMRNEVPGVVVPDSVMARMLKAPDKESQRAVGITISREIITEIKSQVQGIATSTPFGNVQTAIEVCQDF